MAAIVEMAPRVYRIPTTGDFVNTIVFFEEDGSVTLVDCGYKKAPPRIVAGLAAIGKSPKDVQKIILTHAHGDHAGGAAEMVKKSEIDGVDIHEDDAEFVVVGTPAPSNQGKLLGRFLTRTKQGAFPAVPVATEFSDGQLLDVAGGLRIHHTPGHSPGHVSLMHEPSSLLITGDAIWNMTSRMSWPVSAFCTDHILNRKSAHVLGELEYEIAAFTHGPHISDNAREAVRGFLKRKGY